MISSIKNIFKLSMIFSLLFTQNVDVYFGVVDLESNSVDIMYNSEIEIGGAQFDFVGGTLDDYSGGASADAGWTVSGSTTTWIGFSFAGITLPTGENILTQITFSATGDEICLDDVVLSDNAGNTIPVNIGECASLSVNNDVDGCMNIFGLNYDADATIDDGSCEFADYQIEAGSTYYLPSEIVIEVGESIQWNNIGGNHDVVVQSGPEVFSFPNISGPALIGSFTFTLPGTYDYICSVYNHAEMGMVGTVTVNGENTIDGCIDETALNFNPEADTDDESCLYDPFDEWAQSTAQSFYVIDSLVVDGVAIGTDSLFVIGAFCGDTVMTEVGSVQWGGNGTTLVVMGTDGVTEGTDDYCFGGLPEFGIPADIPVFKVFDAVSDEILDAQFNICFDSNGDEADCAWADFGYNNIEILEVGEAEQVEGCNDESALNYNPEVTESDGSCLYDPFDEWIYSTAQSFYVIDSLIVDGVAIENDSLYVIGAFCGDTVMTEVGSVQWDGNGTTLVLNGSDGVTEGTDEYCFGGLPQFGIPADIPVFKVFDAVSDEMLDAQFNICLDSNGDESDCAWADFGYNNIEILSTMVSDGCTDISACNFDEFATTPCDGDNSCCEFAVEFYDCDQDCLNDDDQDEVCDELEIVGCMDDVACNYNNEATDDGECLYEEDCNGECGGLAEIDDCGVCGGDGSTCVTFYTTEFGIYTDENCTGDLVDTISGLCNFEPFFGSEEECTINGGVYISLPICIDMWTSQPVDIDNINECMCGGGGQWDSDMGECIVGQSGYNMWLDEIPLDMDDGMPVSVSLVYDQDNQPIIAIAHFDEDGECHWDYEPSPEEYICEQYGGDWNDYDMECEIDDEDICNELGGFWEENDDEFIPYTVEMDILMLDDDVELEIVETDTGTQLVLNMLEGECEFENQPTQEECNYSGADWNDYDMECEIDDPELCNDLGGQWVEDGACFGMVFENDQINIFGCTEEDNPYYNPEAVIDDGSCSLNNNITALPEQFYLSKNYPNPFNPTTQLSYTIPKYSNVNLSIYDVQGNLVKTIFSGLHKPGEFKVSINGSDMASGMYMAVLNAGDIMLSQKMILLK